MKRSQDADAVNRIISKYSEQARDNGKLFAVFIIIISGLARCQSVLPYTLCFLYLILEYLYSVSITVIYKYILRKYFVPIEDGFALKGGVDPSKVSRKIATYGSIQMIVNAIILIAAIISLILC